MTVGVNSLEQEMIIAGLQKLTLLDYPEKTACTVFIAGCNFACPYCYNVTLIDKNNKDITPLATDDFFEFLKPKKGLLDAVCISGGEPGVHGQLIDFAGKIKDMGFLVKIDTNGSNPQLHKNLINSGNVDYIAMDIKNTLEKYPETIGIPGYDTTPVEESIKLLMSCDVPYEFRTTVVRDFHTKDDVCNIARMINGAEKYFLQSFDSTKEALCENLTAYTVTQLKEILESVKEILLCAELRGIS